MHIFPHDPANSEPIIAGGAESSHETSGSDSQNAHFDPLQHEMLLAQVPVEPHGVQPELPQQVGIVAKQYVTNVPPPPPPPPPPPIGPRGRIFDSGGGVAITSHTSGFGEPVHAPAKYMVQN